MDAAKAQGITEQLEPGKQLVEKQKVGASMAGCLATSGIDVPAGGMLALHEHAQLM